MTSQLWKDQAFTVSHADGTSTVQGGFKGGLRGFFEYRDLGVNSATKGGYGANVIRTGPPRRAHMTLP